MNPNKFITCQYLIEYHEARGDKIIVFSDNIFSLKHYAKKLSKPFVYGPTTNTERLKIFSQFEYSANGKTIFISKVGDTSIDLPEANVKIQISAQYGSRRQEAQRLGRILRPKSGNILRNDGDYDAYFYSLVSFDTREMYFSSKRQQFLIDQGYAFKTYSEIQELKDRKDLFYSTKKEQLELLTEVLCSEEEAGNIEQLLELEQVEEIPVPLQSIGSISALSGGNDLNYMEFFE